MSLLALNRRLAKLEAALPTTTPPEQDRPRIDMGAIVAEIEAESARVAAMPPKEKIVWLRSENVRRRRQLEEPSGNTNPLAASLRALERKLVEEDDHPADPFEIRRCELVLLAEAGYDVTTLAAHHRRFADLPWQYRYEQTPLPPDAQALIDEILFDA